MKTISYHLTGITKTFELLSKGKYLLFFIPGAVITILFFSFQSYTNSINEAVNLSSEYSWIDWIAGYVNSGIHKAFGIIESLLNQLYIFVVLTVLSPFNTFLGEKLDSELTGQTFKGGLIRFLNDFIRMLFVVFLILILEFGLMGIYWLISWIFGLGFLDSIIYWVMSAFFFGFAFYDFALERYQETVFKSLGFAFQKPLTMILTGGIFLIIYKIPLIGIPLSPVITVMISTVVYLYVTKRLPAVKNELKTNENE